MVRTVRAALLAGMTALASVLSPTPGATPHAGPPRPLSAETAPAKSAIRQWIKDLDDNHFRVREAARDRLAKAGHAALPDLTEAACGKSLEAALRAVGILRELSQSAATDAAVDALTAAVSRVAKSTRSRVVHEARMILLDLQGHFVRRLEQLGASVRREAGQVVAVNLDNARELAKALPLLRRFPALSNVSLSNRRMNDALMAELRGLPNLRELVLFRSGIGDDGLKHFKTMPKLRHVPMGQTKVTDAGLVYLKDLTQLAYVGVRGNAVTDAGLRHLSGLTNLTGLHLGETRVTDAGLIHLRGMKKMNQLWLDRTKVSDAGLEHLRGMASLQFLTLAKTAVTAKGLARLRQVVPGVQVDMQPRQ